MSVEEMRGKGVGNMRSLAEKIHILMTVYVKTILGYRGLALYALLSGVCCLAVLLGVAVLLSPNEQYKAFSEDLYCQWRFHDALEYSLLDDRLSQDMDTGAVASFEVAAKVMVNHRWVLIYGLSDDLLRERDKVLYDAAVYDRQDQCYIDPCFIPYEYDTRVNEIALQVNERKLNRVGKLFSIPYDFPSDMIADMPHDLHTSVSCEQNPEFTIYPDADIQDSDQGYTDDVMGRIFLPIEVFRKEGIRIGAICLIMNERLTDDERVRIEKRYADVGFERFAHPALSNWSALTREMMKASIIEAWAVELLLFACMINQLIFWEMLMQRLLPIVCRCHTIGGSRRLQKFILAILLLSACLFIDFLTVSSLAIAKPDLGFMRLTLPSAASACTVFTLGLTAYCLMSVGQKSAERE